MAAILVTGAAGFIGSHLCEALVARGDTVYGLDNFDPFYDPAIKRQNLESLANHPRFEPIEGDIRDAGFIEGLLRKLEPAVVVHLAARAGVRPSIEDPLLYGDINIRGTLNILEAMRQVGPTQLTFGSSSSVYGDDTEPPFSEEAPVNQPVSPYAATKKAGEALCYTYCHLFGLSCASLRFFTVYGPRQRPEMAIHKFVRRLYSGETIPFFGDGDSRRDYTYVDDIIQGVLGAIDHPPEGYRAYNLGESETTTLSRLVELCEQATGRQAKLERLPSQPGDVRLTCADIDRARAELGYAPQVPLTAGLPRFVDWYRRTFSVS